MTSTAARAQGPAESGDVDEAQDRSVVGRGLALLEAVSRAGRPLGLAQLARLTSLPKSTVHRLAHQLVEFGLLERTDEGFGFGLRIFEWGSKAERQRHVRRVAMPYLSALHVELSETIHLAVLDGNDVVYVEKVEGHKAVHCPTAVGDRRPAHATALGKAMLAFSSAGPVREPAAPLSVETGRTIRDAASLARQLREIRQTGVSIESEECFAGVSCVAAPVVDAVGDVLAAISITTPTHRFDPRRLAPIVLRTARAVGADLDARQPQGRR
jgi:DNA-binding IclR family transcriptional regulator